MKWKRLPRYASHSLIADGSCVFLPHIVQLVPIRDLLSLWVNEMYRPGTIGQLQLSEQQIQQAAPFGQFAVNLNNLVVDLVRVLGAHAPAAEKIDHLRAAETLRVNELREARTQAGALSNQLPERYAALAIDLQSLLRQILTAISAFQEAAILLSANREVTLREALAEAESAYSQANIIAENPARDYQGTLDYLTHRQEIEEIRRRAEMDRADARLQIRSITEGLNNLEANRQALLSESVPNLIIQLTQAGELAKGIAMGLADTNSIQELLRQYLPNAGQLTARTQQATQAVQALNASLAELQGVNQINQGLQAIRQNMAGAAGWRNRISEALGQGALMEDPLYSRLNRLESGMGQATTHRQEGFGAASTQRQQGFGAAAQDRQQRFSNLNQLATSLQSRLSDIEAGEDQRNAALVDLHHGLSDLTSMYGDLATAVRDIPAPPPLEAQSGTTIGLVIVVLLALGGLAIIFMPTIIKKIKERK